MTDEEIITRTAAYIQEKFAHDFSGHDWWHMYRVWQLSLFLAQKEGADLLVVQLAALLHDLDDFKLSNRDGAGAPLAREWLESLHVNEAIITQVITIIQQISFKGAGVADKTESLEGKIVQDADRLDGIGAIGIARTFAFGGFFHQPIYEPERKHQHHDNFEAYKNARTTTINHFYEKLLLVKDRMHTQTAQQIAARRHQLMEQFLKDFFAEWEGKDWSAS